MLIRHRHRHRHRHLSFTPISAISFEWAQWADFVSSWRWVLQRSKVQKGCFSPIKIKTIIPDHQKTDRVDDSRLESPKPARICINIYLMAFQWWQQLSFSVWQVLKLPPRCIHSLYLFLLWWANIKSLSRWTGYK